MRHVVILLQWARRFRLKLMCAVFSFQYLFCFNRNCVMDLVLLYLVDAYIPLKFSDWIFSESNNPTLKGHNLLIQRSNYEKLVALERSLQELSNHLLKYLYLILIYNLCPFENDRKLTFNYKFSTFPYNFQNKLFPDFTLPSCSF